MLQIEFALFLLQYPLCNILPVHFSLSGGELFDRIAAEDYKMTEAEVINYMRQVCEGLKHMHENSIVHLDVKVRAWQPGTSLQNVGPLIFYELHIFTILNVLYFSLKYFAEYIVYFIYFCLLF